MHKTASKENLIESELFGHEKGAFTGAVSARKGRLDAAHRGTFSLDEIGDMPLGLQPKLLRVLETRTFERLGSVNPVTVDVRYIAATHRDLEQLARDELFRPDLYYRLNLFEIRIPPLRDRLDDITLLAHHFLNELNRSYDRRLTASHLPEGLLAKLSESPVPGSHLEKLEVKALQDALSRAGGNQTAAARILGITRNQIRYKVKKSRLEP